MGTIICIANQKGGVGKTTTAINLSAALAVSERPTLLVDCDPQGNATTGIGIDKTAFDKSLYHGMIQDTPVGDIILDSQIETLKIIPSRTELIGFEIEMVTHPQRDTALKTLLSPVADAFEFIVIDCPPSLSLLTVNAMTAARDLLIPLQCEFYALEGLGQLLQTIKRIRQGLNPGLRISGILLTMFDRRTNLSFQVAEEAEKYFRDLVYRTTIPRNVRLGEAPSFGKPIIFYDAASPGAKSYFKLAKEILSKNAFLNEKKPVMTST